MYFHRLPKTNVFMEEGKDIHNKWADTIAKEKKLTVGQTTLVFEAPRTEHVEVVQYGDLFDLKGVFDCVDKDTLYEWKTGTQDLSFYMNSYQVPIYFLLSEIAGHRLEKGVIILYNQYEKKCEAGVIWNSEEVRESARNFIDSIAPDIYQYFVDNGLPFDKGVKDK